MTAPSTDSASAAKPSAAPAGASSPLRFLPERAAKAWSEAPPGSRFGFRMNTRLVAIILASPAVLWAYWLYVAIAHGFSWSLGIFTVVYVLYTAWLLAVVAKWRAFCLRSAVIITSSRLVWTHSGEVFEARWGDIDPRKLGLDKMASMRQLEYHLLIPSVDGKKHLLWLYRLYGLMDDLENFIKQLLERSQRGQVMVNKRNLPVAPSKLQKGFRPQYRPK